LYILVSSADDIFVSVDQINKMVSAREVVGDEVQLELVLLIEKVVRRGGAGRRVEGVRAQALPSSSTSPPHRRDHDDR
jgi:hypothetical protein